MIIVTSISLMMGCATVPNTQTVTSVDISRFMGKWYVITGRTSFLEKGAHNSVEIYTWNAEEKRIDIDFSFREDSFSGKVKKLPQKGWIENEQTNAHWKIQPFWPLKFNYYIVGLDENYQWTAIGVPDQKYLWIMARTPQISDELRQLILERLKKANYDTANLIEVPQRWE